MRSASVGVPESTRVAVSKLRLAGAPLIESVRSPLPLLAAGRVSENACVAIWSIVLPAIVLAAIAGLRLS